MSPNLTRAEAQQRSRLVTAGSYEILLDLGGRDVPEADTFFRSRTTLHYQGQDDGISHVDLIAEEITELLLDGQTLEVDFDGSRFELPVTPGDHELQVTAVHRYSRSGEGLHRFVDPADDRVYLYTQFEPADARRVFACFDQPDQKATFEFTVIAPESWLVLSNAPAVDPEPVGNGLGRWEFAPTLRMSTYITGLIAGEYHRVTDSHTGAGGEIPLSLVCRRSMIEHLDVDRLLDTTRAGFEVFEKHFGLPYPFTTYDQIFVPEFNAGAMENAGLVTIRDEYLFRSRVTAAAHEGRDNTILHELAHMWFGNLVTMTWWDDLWLNESFAEWASHFCQSEYLDDPERPWVTFCNARKTWAYRQDQLPTTHPIAADMVDLEAVEQNFDGITYAKGASALRQLVAYVGKDNFLAGVRQYFSDHAFANTQLSDLLDALTAASGRDLSDWSRQWLEVSGVSTLRAEFEVDDQGRFTTFAVRQSVPEEFPVLRDHRVAIGLYADRDGVLTRVHRVELDVAGELTEVADLVGVEQPDLVLLNDDDLTYAKVRLDPRSLDTLVQRIGDLDSALARAVCWAAAWDMCRDGE
ncbi:MAG: aminopeptidase N, partial [Propionibacterium sp.]|nr:aminopeptidase N [Propionibacterium sp.]